MKRLRLILVAAVLAVTSLVVAHPFGGAAQVTKGKAAVTKAPAKKAPPKKAPPKKAPPKKAPPKKAPPKKAAPQAAKPAATGTVSEGSLPPQAKSVLTTLKAGGKVNQGFKQDGTVFQNREGQLPAKADKSYYSEYTVVTPGAKTRGTRRIIKGKGGEYYYTTDHYKTFKKIQ